MISALGAVRKLNRALLRLEFMVRPDFVLAKPRHAIFEMTSRCQLRCPLCNTGGLAKSFPDVEQGRMTLDTFKRGLDRLLPQVEDVLLYNWGEPLLNPDLFRCIEYATSRKVSTTISTNAMAYQESMADKMMQSGLSKIIVSCDGLTQETYAGYRVGGKLETVTKAVRHLIREKKLSGATTPHIQMQFIVFRHNQDEMEEYERLWKSEGVDSVSFIHMSYMSKAGKKEAERRNMVPTKPGWEPHFPYGTLKSCNDPYDHVSVNWNGDLYTCCFPSGDTRFKRGNILDGSFLRLYNSPGWRYSRRLLRTQRSTGTPAATMCHDCTGVFPATGEWPSYWIDPASGSTCDGGAKTGGAETGGNGDGAKTG